ncbi:hypothetical protein BH09MYX1_BH09MYX1_47480 [soil metagenome]
MRMPIDKDPALGRKRQLPFGLAKIAGFGAIIFAATLGLGACESCHPNGGGPKPPLKDDTPPTIRFYLVSDFAGALEPCGCVKDQLGGLDHMAAWLNAQKTRNDAPGDSFFVTSGPLFFLDPTLKEEKKAQELAKAQTLAASLKSLDFVAFAPGRNDWALGQETLVDLGTRSGGVTLAGNAKGAPQPWRGPILREAHGVKVGFIGVAAPDKATEGEPLGGLVCDPPVESVKADVASLKAQGASIVVLLAAVGRGEAKRLADAVPDATAILVGSTGGGGEENTETPPPELVGNVLVVETGNHLQTVAVLDLFVRNGSLEFQDGTGLSDAQKRADLTRRIDDLRGKIADWEKSGKVSPQDLDARKRDLDKLKRELTDLDKKPAPTAGSYFRIAIQEVRDELGTDKTVHEQLLAYYKKVNDDNKLAFANKLPVPAAADAPFYAGIESCTKCHAAPRAVWYKTAHAGAYKTLQTGFKEFNLDCVSCHVTGYDRPGGSTVTHVEKLQDVQCEVCHGPSGKHAASPKTPPPVPRPSTDVCLTCHHPPHVHTFDASTRVLEILGPGHGKPL